jgi:hypothetical protein
MRDMPAAILELGNAMMRGRASTDKSLESPDTVGLLEEGRIYDTSERNEQAILA